jgi:hypothetical protein
MRTRNVSLLLVTLTLAAGNLWSAAPSIPRMPDGKPDLNGTWDNGGGIEMLRPQKLADGSVCISGCAPVTAAGSATPAAPAAPAARPAPDRPRYRPEFVARVKALEAAQVREDPVLRCQPPGVPRIGPPDKIIQTARELVFLYEDVSGPFFRIVPLSRDVKRLDDSESYLGDAYGRWDGDTLVVETTNFNELTWLTDDGSFHTDKLKVTERLVPVGNEITWTAVADDPAVLAEPWQVRSRKLVRTPKEMAEPAPCVEQDLEHMVDDSHHDNGR